MKTEVKQRKVVVRKKREKPTQTAQPEEVKFSAFFIWCYLIGKCTEI